MPARHNVEVRTRVPSARDSLHTRMACQVENWATKPSAVSLDESA